MPVTAKLSRAFYEQVGEQAATELVDWLNAVDQSYRADLRELNELNFARFDAKLEQRVVEVLAKTDRRFARLEMKMNERFAEAEVKVNERFAQLPTQSTSASGSSRRGERALRAVRDASEREHFASSRHE